jgi:hypothetical protein
MHLIINTNGGGIFSLLNQAIRKILFTYEGRYDVIESFKIRLVDYHFIQRKDFFDNLFDYSNCSDNTHNITIPNEDVPHRFSFLRAFTSEYYNSIKRILSKNTINKDILSVVSEYQRNFKIDENTLGIHVRLTDMNICHTDVYKYVSIEDYYIQINAFIKANPSINSFFIASDNDESIAKIIQKYGDKYTISYIKDTYRVPNEDSDNLNFILNNFNNIPDIEQKIFTEVLTMTKCGYFIHRISDVANFMILYSDTFKEVKCLN